MWICTFLVIATAGEAVARDEVIPLESPDYFVEVFGGYGQRVIGEAFERVEDQGITIPEQTLTGWFAGGSATLPIRSGVGVRMAFRGGVDRLSQDSLRTEQGGVAGRSELFWRDPTKGQFGAGYGYAWATPRSASRVQSVRTHSLPAFASLYMPDFGGGAVDWSVYFQYDWATERSSLGDTRRWAYEVMGSSRWYVTRFIGFEGGVRYTRLLGASPQNRIEGVFSLEALIPSGTRHYGTLALMGSVGRTEQEDLPAPFGSVSSTSWQIGIQASVHFPGVTSLVELNRAYR